MYLQKEEFTDSTEREVSLSKTIITHSEQPKFSFAIPSEYIDGTGFVGDDTYDKYYYTQESGSAILILNDYDVRDVYYELIGLGSPKYEVCGDENALLYEYWYEDSVRYISMVTINGVQYGILFDNLEKWWTIEDVKAILDTCPDSELAGSEEEVIEENSEDVSESGNNTVLRSENNKLILYLPARFEDALNDYTSLDYESYYEDEQEMYIVALMNKEMSDFFLFLNTQEKFMRYAEIEMRRYILNIILVIKDIIVN